MIGFVLIVRWICISFPNKKYNIIYADPAWSYDENWGNGCVKHHYETTGIEEMKKLPVADIADDNCYLYMWYTNPFVQEALDLVKAWGFKYKQTITWIKTYKDGTPIMGLGYDFRVCTEHLILAKKGSLKRLRKDLKNVIFSPQRQHSQKPDEVRDLIIEHVGDLPRIELFARQQVQGWDCWGNEV